jgi:amidase
MTSHAAGASDQAPAGLLDAFRAYESALMANDTAILDDFFAPGPRTLRGDGQGLLVGHDAISRFRASRGGVPRREIIELHVQAVDDDHALLMSVSEFAHGGRGLQTQAWVRLPAGWKITAAHVTGPPPPVRD